MALPVTGGFQEPCRDIIQRSAAFPQTGDPPHLGALELGLVFRPDEGRVADDIAAFFCWQQRLPVQFQRIAMGDGGGFAQRNAQEGRAERNRPV